MKCILLTCTLQSKRVGYVGGSSKTGAEPFLLFNFPLFLWWINICNANIFFAKSYLIFFWISVSFTQKKMKKKMNYVRLESKALHCKASPGSYSYFERIIWWPASKGALSRVWDPGPTILFDAVTWQSRTKPDQCEASQGFINRQCENSQRSHFDEHFLHRIPN